MKSASSQERKTDRATGLRMLHQMLLIRRFEEKSAEMYTKSSIRGFLHLYIGEEAVAVGVMQALTEEDYVLATYREHGHALARGMDAGSIMAEMYGKQEGCSRGRGGSMHLFEGKKLYGGNAIVAGHLSMAVGMALAAKKQKKDTIACCFFGEGAMAEGEFHEAMNLAALWEAPVLFVCENNQYAMGTALRFTHAETHLEKQGAAYGIETTVVDGMDVLAVTRSAKEAVQKIRAESRPFFLVCNTYRFRAHSMFDAELYRDKAEVEIWKERDPIVLLGNYLIDEKMITEQEVQEMDKAVEAEVQKAVAFAEAGTWEPIEDLTKFVYSEK